MNSKNKLTQLKNGSGTYKEELCISLVGPVGCGKSALIVKYLTRRFIGEYDPQYEGCWTKAENVDNIDLNVQIMDTYDKEKKKLEKFCKWSDIMILVFSIIDHESFVLVQDYLESLMEIIKQQSNLDDSSKKFTKLVLLGNKIDMERYRQIYKTDVECVLKKYGSKRISDSTNTIISDLERINSPHCLNIAYVESTSCEEYDLVQNLFHRLIREHKKEREIFQNLNQPDDGMMAKPKLTRKQRDKSPNLKSNSISSQANMISTSAQNQLGSYGEHTNSLPLSSSFTNGPINNHVNLKDVKKNQLKFPFLNKILNKS